MPWKTNLLVVANRTAESDELLSYLRGRAHAGPIRVTLVVPIELGGRDLARERLERAVARMEAEGIEAHGSVSADDDPLHAVMDVYDAARHDEVIISTLPAHLSRWLGCDLPQRVGRTTGALVHHVESRAAPAVSRR